MQFRSRFEDAFNHSRSQQMSSSRLLILSIIFAGLGLAVILLMIAQCTKKPAASPASSQGGTVSVSDVVSPGSAEAQSAAQTTEPAPAPTAPPRDPKDVKADALLAQMTQEQKAAQLILVRGDTMTQEQLLSFISTYKVGGVVLFGGNFKDKTSQQVKDMTTALQAAADGQLLICADEEGGTVVRLSSNPNLRQSKFKSPQKLYASGGMDAIISDTREKCAFLRSYGVNVNFAPVADVVTNSSGFLYSRAFGRDAQQTAQYVSNVVTVMNECNVGSSIKHFPGYGNSSGDTHKGLVVSNITSDSLWSSDLVPFRAGIEAGADSIMVTHTVINAIDSVNPASLSPACMSLIRDQLGFDGVIVTDGLDMGAITSFCGGSDPCVKAICAGADLLCTPSDSAASYNALLTSIRSGEISAQRLDSAVKRILIWKMDLGLIAY